MADNFVNGTDYLLYIDTTTALDAPLADVDFPGDFKLAACLDDNGFDGSTDQIDTSSKCSGMFKSSLAGQIGWTMSANIKWIKPGVGDTRLSNNDLFALWKAQTRFWVAQFDTDEITVRFGVAYISSFSEASANNAVATASITLQGVGEIYDQDDIVAGS